MIRTVAWPTLLLLLAFTFPGLAVRPQAQQAPSPPAQQTDDAAFQQELNNGKELFRQCQFG